MVKILQQPNIFGMKNFIKITALEKIDQFNQITLSIYLLNCYKIRNWPFMHVHCIMGLFYHDLNCMRRQFLSVFFFLFFVISNKIPSGMLVFLMLLNDISIIYDSNVDYKLMDFLIETTFFSILTKVWSRFSSKAKQLITRWKFYNFSAYQVQYFLMHKTTIAIIFHLRKFSMFSTEYRLPFMTLSKEPLKNFFYYVEASRSFWDVFTTFYWLMAG